MKKIFTILILTVLFWGGFSGFVSAANFNSSRQNPDISATSTTSTDEENDLESFDAEITVEMIDLDENIQAEDLGVGEPRILPDSRLYFLKNWSRGVRSFFTFNPVAKAELKLRFANEKLMEAKKIAETNPEILPKALENYKKETDRLKKRVEKIKETSKNPRVSKFLDKFIDNSLKQQRLFGKFEKDLPPEVYEKIKAIQEESLAKFSDIGLKLAQPEDFKEKLVKIMDKQKGSRFKHFKNLEVLQELENKVPEPAKKAIRKAQENSLKRLQGDLEKMKPEKRKYFSQYLKNIGGNEIRHLAIIDKLEIEELPEDVREKLETAKEKTMERIEKRLEVYGNKNMGKAKENFLGHLMKSGRMEDLRVIKRMENNLSPEAFEHFSDAKRKVKKKLMEEIERKNPEEQEAFLKRIDEKFYDIRQLEVFEELEGMVPEEKKEFFEKMRNKTINRMEREVKKAEGSPKEETKNMILRRIAGNAPEHLEILGRAKLSPGVIKEIKAKTGKNISWRIKAIRNPEKLEILKRKMEDKNYKAELPGVFKQLEAKSANSRGRVNPREAKAYIEKAKMAIIGCEKVFSALSPELQKISEKKFKHYINSGKKHLEKAKAALEEKKSGEAFGQAISAIHSGSNCKRIIERIKTKPGIPEKPIIKPGPITCAQVLTSAVSPNGICKIFRNSCISEGWKKVAKCNIFNSDKIKVEVRIPPQKEITPNQTWYVGYVIKNISNSSVDLVYNLKPFSYITSGAVLIDPDGSGPKKDFYNGFGKKTSLSAKGELYLDISLNPPKGLNEFSPKIIFTEFAVEKPFFTHKFTVKVISIEKPVCEKPVCLEGQTSWDTGGVDGYRCPIIRCVAIGKKCTIVSPEGICKETPLSCDAIKMGEGWKIVDKCPIE